MDDPIFDPWAAAGDDGPTGVSRDPRAGSERPGDPRSVAGRTRSGTPAEPGPRRWVVPLGSPERRPSRPMPRTDRPDAGVAPVPPAPGAQPGHVRAMQDVVLPRLDALRGRLELAGHATVLDDRTDRGTPSVRFRFVPRIGPFDEVDAECGTVLEVVWDESAAHVVARLWLDPVAEEWTEEVATPTERVDTAWIDRVIVEFVGKTLRATP